MCQSDRFASMILYTALPGAVRRNVRPVSARIIASAFIPCLLAYCDFFRSAVKILQVFSGAWLLGQDTVIACVAARVDRMCAEDRCEDMVPETAAAYIPFSERPGKAAAVLLHPWIV